MLDERKALALVAETAREIRILIVVFAPLEASFHEHPPPGWQVALVVGLALIFIAGGIILEAEE